MSDVIDCADAIVDLRRRVDDIRATSVSGFAALEARVTMLEGLVPSARPDGRTMLALLTWEGTAYTILGVPDRGVVVTLDRWPD